MTAKEFILSKYKYLGWIQKPENEIIDFEFNDLCNLLDEYYKVKVIEN